MRLLVIDTSSVVSVALLELQGSGGDAPRVLSDSVGSDTHRHAEDLVPAVRSALAEVGWERPDAVLVGEGPGPFTGLRVGLATADTLAFAWGVPVYGICSLDGLGHQVAHVSGAQEQAGFVAALDARRKELYWARYDAAGVRVDGPHVGAPATVPGALPSALPVAGAGASVRAAELAEAGLSTVPGTEQLPVSAAHLGLAWVAAGCPTAPPRARYLRESDAVVPGSMAGVDLTAGRVAR